MKSIDEAIIAHVVRISGLPGFKGSFKELGGGEINDTYVLDFQNNQKVVLRVAKYPDEKLLHQEARALRLLSIEQVPKLLFFDEQNLPEGRPWILESYIAGKEVGRLTVPQWRSLGKLLAHIHKVQSGSTGVDVWSCFLSECQLFGDERKLLSHPDKRLKRLMTHARQYVRDFQSKLDNLPESLVHGDVTASNMLVNGDTVSLIDWEFSKFKDPMADFSTMFYEDMEYNKGKWRVHISPHERQALFAGYESADGVIDESRLRLWMNLDKLSAAVFLYWRMHESGRPADLNQTRQYQLDLGNLLDSLENNLLEAF